MTHLLVWLIYLCVWTSNLYLNYLFYLRAGTIVVVVVAGGYTATRKASHAHYLGFLWLLLCFTYICIYIIFILILFVLVLVKRSNCNGCSIICEIYDKQLECITHNLENLQEAFEMLTHI